MAADEISTGELGRRMDEVRDSVRELTAKFDDLDTKFVPRAELDERHRLIDLQVGSLESAVATNRRELESYKTNVATARRWAIGTAITGGGVVAALVANIAFH